MKTVKINHGKRLHKIILMLVAGLISMNLMAQKSIRSYEFQKFTDNLFKSTEQIMKAFSNHASEELAFDEDIEFEDWMTDLNQWVINMDSGSSLKNSLLEETELLKEKEMEFEEWMFRTDWMNEENASAIDEEMEFEKWMLRPFERTDYITQNTTTGRK